MCPFWDMLSLLDLQIEFPLETFSHLEEATIEETDVKRKHSQRMQMPTQGSRCRAFHDLTTRNLVSLPLCGLDSTNLE